MNKLFPLFALSTLLLVPLGAQGAFAITFEFEFEVTEIDDIDDLLDGILEEGDTVGGHYSFDPNTPDSEFLDTIFGLYAHDAFSIHFDSIVYDNQPPFDNDGSDSIFVVNDFIPGDAYAVTADGLAQTSGTPLLPHGDLFFLLIDEDGTVYSDDSLPLSPPDLSEFEDTTVELFLSDEGIMPFSFDGKSLPILPSELETQQGEVFILGIITSITIPQEDIVGGEGLPIDSTALVLAGLQSSAVWMLPILVGAASAGFAAFKLRRI